MRNTRSGRVWAFESNEKPRSKMAKKRRAVYRFIKGSKYEF
ncbi:hypothetical protein ADIS_2700 [Lunatimonas lonarensis]|uniref:Uncharacterized protein n=1 Tax=Lunatimonas lonarensis TaxID=1232681 RepID=R7ZS51_9BACT|nr:hypothetical protein ADIS_2700 [Lunatimonas lonarensis]